MKDNNITFQLINREGNQSILFEVNGPKEIDQIAYKALKLECPEYIIPFTVSGRDKTLEVTYDVSSNKVNLHEYEGTMKIGDILNIYKEMIEELEDCGNLFLKKECFCFDTQYVFLNKEKMNIHLLYVPYKHCISKEADIKQVLIELLEKCDANSGQNIQVPLYKYFYKPKFSLKEFKTLLDTMQIETEIVTDMEIASTEEIALPAAQKPDKAEKLERNNYAQATIDKIVQLETSKHGSPLEDTAKTSNTIQLTQKDKETPLAAPKAETFQSKVFNDNKRKNLFGTMFSATRDNKTEPPSIVTKQGLRLKLSNNKSKYNLPKTIPILFTDDTFTIGRADELSKVQGSTFEFNYEVNPVSREHAAIEQKDEQYYLIDKGSRNGTFLNGKRIEPHKSYKLFDDDIIAFAIAFSDNSIRYVFVEE